MASDVMHFAVKSIGLSEYGNRKKCTLLEAARHNLREIQAEQGANGHIDPTRTHQNVIMAGPSSATEVMALSASLAAGEGVDLTKLRKDYCHAYELVFSLPTDSSIDSHKYFSDCLKWSGEAYGLPVLLATVHCDEATKHLHVLLLPVNDGKYVGCKPLAPEQTQKKRDSFFKAVAGPAGLKRSNAKFYGNAKRWAVAAVLQECETRNLPVSNGVLWPVFKASIERDPTAAMMLLNIDVNSIRPRDAVCPQAPAPERPIGFEEVSSMPIGFNPEGMEMQNLSCVGFLSKRTSTVRLSIAREAERRGRERQANKNAAPATSAVELAGDDGLIRVKDADFDPAAWNY